MNVEGCYFCQDEKENSGDDPHCGNIEDHDDDVDVIRVIKKRKRKVS